MSASVNSAPRPALGAPEEAPPAVTAAAALIQTLRNGPLTAAEAAELAGAVAGIARAPSREAADLLLEVISRRELRLYRHQGTTLHTLAVEALLELGHPFALEVPPEALEEANQEREEQALRAEFPWSGLGVFILASLLPLVSALIASRNDSNFDSEALFDVVVTVTVGMIAVVPALNRRKSGTRAAGITLTALIGLVELGVAYLVHESAGSQLGWLVIWGLAATLHMGSALLFMKDDR
jgi:hypothetical protein